MHLPTNTLLQGDKYKITEKVGQGGFGIAYKADHQLLNRVVCIKEFYYSDLCERKAASSDITIVSTSSEKIKLVNSFKKKFVKEAQRLAKFQHPNIVQVTDVFEENNTAYFVMEYLEGGSLEDKLKSIKMSEKQTLDIVLPILDALAIVHKAKLLHLDIKPLNIMFRKDKTPVLIDFGISKYMTLAGGYTTTPVGLSKGYAPLEQYGGDISDFSEATDIYSVCATIYRMVSGDVPPEPLQILSNGLTPLSSFQSNISKNLNAAINKGLSINKSDRFTSVSDFIKCLKNSDQNVTISQTNILSDNTEAVGAPFKLNSNLYKYTEISSYSGGLAEVELNNKYGFIGKGGQEIAPCIYDECGYFLDERCRVKLNNNYGFIDSNGNEITPCKYQEAENFSEGLARVKYNHRWGYIDSNGNEITPCKYQEAKNFSEGLAGVKYNDRWGYIDSNGNEITPCKYQEAENFSEGLARVKYNHRWGYIDKNGDEVIPCQYYSAYDFSEGRAQVHNGSVYGTTFINKSGQKITSKDYHSAFSFSDGLAAVEKSTSEFSITNRDLVWGFIDINGKKVIPFIYDFVQPFVNGYASVMKKNFWSNKEKWGIINKHNEIIVPIMYDDCSDAEDALSNSIDSVTIKNWKMKAFDKKGKLLFSADLNEDQDITNEYVVVDGTIFGSEDEDVFVDKNGKLLVPGIYEDLSDFSNDRARVVRNKKYGFIDTLGKEIIPCKYDRAWDFVDGVALVKLKKMFYAIDIDGNIISK